MWPITLSLSLPLSSEKRRRLKIRVIFSKWDFPSLPPRSFSPSASAWWFIFKRWFLVSKRLRWLLLSGSFFSSKRDRPPQIFSLSSCYSAMSQASMLFMCVSSLYISGPPKSAITFLILSEEWVGCMPMFLGLGWWYFQIAITQFPSLFSSGKRIGSFAKYYIFLFSALFSAASLRPPSSLRLERCQPRPPWSIWDDFSSLFLSRLLKLIIEEIILA